MVLAVLEAWLELFLQVLVEYISSGFLLVTVLFELFGFGCFLMVMLRP